MTWDVYYKKLEDRLDAEMSRVADLESELEAALERIAALEETVDELRGLTKEADE